MFQNLIGNAVKFRGQEPLHITVRAQRVRDEWRIGIKDNGIGIAEEDARRIFGMFERASTDEDRPGTGMGLARDSTCRSPAPLPMRYRFR